MNLHNFYHNQFAIVVTCEHCIEEIDYYSQYGNWPISLAVWLQRRRIQWARLVIQCLNLLPEVWLKNAPSSYGPLPGQDNIPF